jgi:hypothetical protein
VSPRGAQYKEIFISCRVRSIMIPMEKWMGRSWGTYRGIYSTFLPAGQGFGELCVSVVYTFAREPSTVSKDVQGQEGPILEADQRTKTE